MPSIEQIKASDGTANANMATVQNTRSPGASTIIVDTVLGINPDGFMASMGTPHTFTDPITSETITVISEDTAVDFSGHVDGTNLEIDDIAPGYADTNGSEVGDIIIIRPTTQWGDNVAAVLGAEHQDDGTHGAITPTSVTSSGPVTAPSFVRTGTGSGIGWDPLGATPDTVTANGNRSYNLVFNANDLTDTLSPGMRLRMVRSSAAPTQSASLNGSTNYFSKTSPSGMTFTDDFVVSAWIKLTSYPTQSTIAARYNGTSGWSFRVNGSGQVSLFGFNAGATNYRGIGSNLSVPLNKWVHIAAQLDMSTNTATPTTSYVMFDGVDIPAATITNGSNPTALIQAGDLQIGAENGAQFFPGKIAQVAIYSAKVTQATIKASMPQTLTGSETSLISAYSFNNLITDLKTGTANNLTNNGSTSITNADTPFTQTQTGVTAGTTDYGIVMSASFSTNTTLVVQVPEGDTLPTTGSISGVDYSIGGIPYGFPKQKGKWAVTSLGIASFLQNSPVNNTWYNIGSHQLSLPVGEWQLSYQNSPYASGSTGIIFYATLSTGSSTESNVEFTTEAYISTTISIAVPRYRSRPVSVAAITPYYLNLCSAANSISQIQSVEGKPTIIEAENAYL